CSGKRPVPANEQDGPIPRKKEGDLSRMIELARRLFEAEQKKEKQEKTYLKALLHYHEGNYKKAAREKTFLQVLAVLDYSQTEN
ncbi:hypothetical protein ACFLYT_00125, partial [Nanoarchaeota archaeon]